jgi:purine-cytosine permease-like protein
VSIDGLRLLSRIHAIAAWTATAALIAAAWVVLLRPPQKRLAIGAGGGAVLSISITGALGLLLEDAYRARLRQRLFVEAPGLGWLFERKEHVAFAAILLGWSALFTLGAAWLVAARARRRGPAEAALAALSGELFRAARVGFTATAILALTASVASTIVARGARF